MSGAYAVSFIQGFEHAREVTYPLQASACCKHFVANELDASNGTDRYHFDSIVPQQDLVDSYLPVRSRVPSHTRAVCGLLTRPRPPPFLPYSPSKCVLRRARCLV